LLFLFWFSITLVFFAFLSIFVDENRTTTPQSRRCLQFFADSLFLNLIASTLLLGLPLSFLFLLSLALHPRSPLLFRTTLLGYALSPLGVLALTPLLRQLFSSLLLSLLTPSNTLTPAYGTLGLLIDRVRVRLTLTRCCACSSAACFSLS